MKSLELYKPLKWWYTGQTFGQDTVCIDDNEKLVSGSGAGVCPAGFVSFYQKNGLKGHNGIDVGADMWQPVYASTDGTILEISTEANRGMGVIMITDEKYFFEGGDYFARTLYWHFAGVNVKPEQKVRIGDLIGWADSTGKATGPHLHFELKPMLYDTQGKLYNVFQDNGFYGAVNPEPYLQKQSAYELKTNLEKLKDSIAELASKIQDYLLRKT